MPARSIEFRCHLCGSKSGKIVLSGLRDWEYGTAGEWEYQRCNSCGIVSIHPFPNSSTLLSYYPANYNEWSEGKSSVLFKFLQYSLEKLEEKSIRNLISPDKSVLDVGCGSGAFLERLKPMTTGHLCGLDFSPKATELAKRKGVETYTGTLQSFSGGKNSYDVVFMNAYLEHSPDPAGDLAQAAYVLRPGGWLCGEVPNFGSWDRRVFGRFWAGNHTPRHLYQFEKRTLSEMLTNRGFTNIEFSFSLTPTCVSLSMQHVTTGVLEKLNVLKNRYVPRMPYYPIYLLAAAPINFLLVIGRVAGAMNFRARIGPQV